MTTVDRWLTLMAELGLRPESETFERLSAAWAEPHRSYHSTTHLEACLATFDGARALARRPAEVELALWFHDAVYRAKGGGEDEERSAEWAADFLLAAGADEEIAARVRALVLATRHDAAVEDPDAGLVVDIDLAILGRDEVAYDAFEEGVRAEYRWVPGPLFRRERRKVLRRFLNRPRIFHTEALGQRFEARARANLTRAIAALGG